MRLRLGISGRMDARIAEQLQPSRLVERAGVGWGAKGVAMAITLAARKPTKERDARSSLSMRTTALCVATVATRSVRRSSHPGGCCSQRQRMRSTTAEHGAICDIKTRHLDIARIRRARLQYAAKQSKTHGKSGSRFQSSLGPSSVFSEGTGRAIDLGLGRVSTSRERARILRRFRCVSQMAQIAAVGSLPRGPFANAAVCWHW